MNKEQRKFKKVIKRRRKINPKDSGRRGGLATKKKHEGHFKKIGSKGGKSLWRKIKSGLVPAKDK
jgi:hypothetical protein